jgi:HTH-type transcriptional repressor of NAD biosynthesis genes
MRFQRGLVIGKFLPPHRGHKFLIDSASAQCEHVTVIVCAQKSDSIEGKLRQQWLREIHPDARVMLIDDHYDPADSKLWAELTIQWLGSAPDAVFTSEEYGERYAGYMGCKHLMIDKVRQAVPCSGTIIRSDPYTNWDFLEPPVKAWFARRVCVLGAESTGTTTMAQALAGHYQTNWVAEYGREYSEIKSARGDAHWLSDEFVHIAREQNRREDQTARVCNRLLICDTNAFATALWHRRYMNSPNDAVAELARDRKYDLYLLTGDEIPFVQDGLRDGQHIRHMMHQWFVEALGQQLTPWRLLFGDHETRLKSAIAFIDELFPRSYLSGPKE